MIKIRLLNGTLVNEGQTYASDIEIEDKWISRIESVGGLRDGSAWEFDLEGAYVLPGVIDTHVHFREPGFPDKGNIESESKAAVAGGVTSCMDMPNTMPPTTNLERLHEKLRIAKATSLTNYAFYLGATTDNLSTLCATAPGDCCGVKVFMGASTGSLLVKDDPLLEKIFARVPHLIALHAEDEASIQRELDKAVTSHGVSIPFAMHSAIRHRHACVKATKKALNMAKIHGSQLHILHLSTKEEVDLFSNEDLLKKRRTAEVALPHLFFHEHDYAKQAQALKVNPAIKKADDQSALWKGLLDNRIDTIGSDHAPHAWYEKKRPYTSCPSGTPLIQYGLLLLLEAVKKKRLKWTQVVQKTAHAPALRYGIKNRGFLKPGYFADMVVVEPNHNKQALASTYSHCGWTPIQRSHFEHLIKYTFVSGHLAYKDGYFFDSKKGQRITFIPLPIH